MRKALKIKFVMIFTIVFEYNDFNDQEVNYFYENIIFQYFVTSIRDSLINIAE